MLKNNINNWYLLQHKPNKQKIALDNLKRQGFETFYPLFEQTRKINSKFKNFLSPLFPGYIFVSFNIKENKWIKIKSTIGILRIISFGNKPTSVPEEIVSELRLKYNKINHIELNKENVIGKNIKVIKGPFSGFVGEIENLDDKRRLNLLLKFMNNKKNILIDLENTDLIFRF